MYAFALNVLVVAPDCSGTEVATGPCVCKNSAGGGKANCIKDQKCDLRTLNAGEVCTAGNDTKIPISPKTWFGYVSIL